MRWVIALKVLFSRELVEPFLYAKCLSIKGVKFVIPLLLRGSSLLYALMWPVALCVALDTTVFSWQNRQIDGIVNKLKALRMKSRNRK